MYSVRSALLLALLSLPLFAKTEQQNTVQVQASKKLPLKIEELRKIQAKLQDYQFLTLDFQQTIYKKLRNKSLTNKGEVYFKKPSSFRWRFDHAEPEEWVYDGSSLLHYFPAKAYAHRYKAHAAKGKNLREIVNMVLDFDSLLKRYNVSSSYKEGNIVTLTLLPKERGEITQVGLVLNLERNFISEVKLGLEGGNKSVFTFSNPRYSQSKSGFDLPPKVKVTDAI